MAERTVARGVQCFPVPESLDDATAAAIPNPGVSAWLSLKHLAKLSRGETVLVLGSTGVTGKLAVQIAKIFGAGRVVAAGRNEERLAALSQLGADATIPLNQPDQDLIAAFKGEAGQKQFDVIIDYVWGHPTELLLAAITKEEFAPAGPTIKLPAAVLRSSPVTILGTAGIPPWDVLADALQQVMNHAASGELRIETESVPLRKIESAWTREVPAAGWS